MSEFSNRLMAEIHPRHIPFPFNELFLQNTVPVTVPIKPLLPALIYTQRYPCSEQNLLVHKAPVKNLTLPIRAHSIPLLFNIFIKTHMVCSHTEIFQSHPIPFLYQLFFLAAARTSVMTECSISAMISSNTIITKHLVVFSNDSTCYLNIYLFQI